MTLSPNIPTNITTKTTIKILSENPNNVLSYIVSIYNSIPLYFGITQGMLQI